MCCFPAEGIIYNRSPRGESFSFDFQMWAAAAEVGGLDHTGTNVSPVAKGDGVVKGGTVGASNFEPLFWLRAWDWCFRLVSMLLYEHIWFLNILDLIDNDYRFVIKCNSRIYL